MKRKEWKIGDRVVIRGYSRAAYDLDGKRGTISDKSEPGVIGIKVDYLSIHTLQWVRPSQLRRLVKKKPLEPQVIFCNIFPNEKVIHSFPTREEALNPMYPISAYKEIAVPFKRMKKYTKGC